MDRSMDSIGSCSLDVDVDSSEMSDTSGSANLVTPVSTKDITREFTSKLYERCPINPKKDQDLLIDHESGKEYSEIQTIVTQPTCIISEFPLVTTSSLEKKPSYLNLACCVNGYSSITTYNSKVRQDINKSREVSPIRPSSASIQCCKKNNAIKLPVNFTMPNMDVKTSISISSPTKEPIDGLKYLESNNNYNQNGGMHEQNIYKKMSYSDDTVDGKKNTSFIQQRVERLYGPGALAQGFYSPKKVRAVIGDQADSTEFSRKFQELSPSKDYNEFHKKLSFTATASHSAKQACALPNDTSNTIDLPVLRHLSQEFRAQLPSISPKRSYFRTPLITKTDSTSDNSFKNTSTNEDNSSSVSIDHNIIQSTSNDEVDHQGTHYKSSDNNIFPNMMDKEIISDKKTELVFEATSDASCKKNKIKNDGNYFLVLLKCEESRLLGLANKAETYLQQLSNDQETSEDILGILRSASGKARLLVSQKMKQFEGLCHNNLNQSPEDKFPTTVEDLQGFWDMVNLQVDHINSIYEEIEWLRKNEWKKPIEEVCQSNTIKPKKICTKMKFKPIEGSNFSQQKNMSATNLKREAQRKQLMELKRKHKMAMSVNLTNSAVEPESNSLKSVEIYVNENHS